PFINVYPNSADKYFKITGLEDEEILQLQIFNSIGRNVKTLRNPKTQAIDVRSLPAGLYFLRIVQQDKRTLYSRFVNHPAGSTESIQIVQAASACACNIGRPFCVAAPRSLPERKNQVSVGW